MAKPQEAVVPTAATVFLTFNGEHIAATSHLRAAFEYFHCFSSPLVARKHLIRRRFELKKARRLQVVVFFDEKSAIPTQTFLPTKR
jgi:hypothetical protein